MINRTVAIFGTFDGVHDGHREFIKEARSLGAEVIAIVARDSVAMKLKGKFPINDETKRLKAILKVDGIDSAVLGDSEEGVYKIFKQIRPYIVCLGYDQQELFNSLNQAMANKLIPKVPMIFAKDYNGETLHSSILNKN